MKPNCRICQHDYSRTSCLDPACKQYKAPVPLDTETPNLIKKRISIQTITPPTPFLSRVVFCMAVDFRAEGESESQHLYLEAVSESELFTYLARWLADNGQ